MNGKSCIVVLVGGMAGLLVFACIILVMQTGLPVNITEPVATVIQVCLDCVATPAATIPEVVSTTVLPPDPTVIPEAGVCTVDLARKYLEWKSSDVKGHLEYFQASGGDDYNCADFACALLINCGQLSAADWTDSTRTPYQTLKANPSWEEVDCADTVPGDVWIWSDYPQGHVAIVTAEGAKMYIGSNNNWSDSVQYILEVEPTREPTNCMHYRM